MKRFTETLKWSDPWFRKLRPEIKLLWQWLCDNCDAAGVIDPDLDLASFQIGYQYPLDTLSDFGDRVLKLKCGKWLIVKFINFQYGDKLSIYCKAHNPIYQSLERHSIDLESIGYGKGIDTPQEKVKVKETVKAKETETVYSPESRVALHFLNEKSGKHFRESETSLAPIHARLSEQGVTIDGVRQMISRQCAMWKETRMQEYLRPETLFGKEKFNSYYAAKDLPVSFEDKKNGQTKNTNHSLRDMTWDASKEAE